MEGAGARCDPPELQLAIDATKAIDATAILIQLAERTAGVSSKPEEPPQSVRS